MRTRLALAAALCAALSAAAAAPPDSLPSAARRWMKSMTPQHKAAQLIFIPFNGTAPGPRSREHKRFLRLVRDVRVGGLVLVNWSNGQVMERAGPYALAGLVNRMQRHARVPLLVAGDFERGASMRVEGVTVFPHAMAFGAAGDPALTRYEGEVTAREARALGVHWVFHPVADVNSNPDNPIINIRSFGENPRAVAEHVRAFIEGARAAAGRPVLTCAKHFPGHGDTSVDTHLNLAVIPAGRRRLDEVELAPFRAAIAAGVDSIMTAHAAVPALAPAEVPATLSPAILTRLLREEMGFRGLVVTDALEMGGIVQGFGPGEAAVRALEAGADVLLMPPDPEAAVKAVLAAIRSGRLSMKRIDESVARVLAAKARVGLDKRRAVDLKAIAGVVDAPESNQRAREIAGRAVTLVRNRGGLVPLRAPEGACFVVLSEGRYSSKGQVFADEVRRRAPAARVIALDPGVSGADLDDAAGKALACGEIVVAAFASVAAYRGTAALAGEYPRLLDAFTASDKPVILVALGNPYLLRSFPNVSAYLATFSTVPPSEAAAVRALFGEAAIGGRLPVTIPGMAQYGEGILRPARTPAAPSASTAR